MHDTCTVYIMWWLSRRSSISCWPNLSWFLIKLEDIFQTRTGSRTRVMGRESMIYWYQLSDEGAMTEDNPEDLENNNLKELLLCCCQQTERSGQHKQTWNFQRLSQISHYCRIEEFGINKENSCCLIAYVLLFGSKKIPSKCDQTQRIKDQTLR